MPIKNRPKQELNEIALDIYHQRIFCDKNLPDPKEQLQSVFPILDLMTKEDRAALIKSKPGMIFEHLSKAMPLGVNGYPMFFSFYVLNQYDTKIVCDLVVKLRFQEKQFLKDES